jgi:hypothetical protein
LLMHEGKLSRGQLQAWALNRYYYRAVSRSKIPSFFRAGPTRSSGARGGNAWSTTMAMPPAKVVSSAG